jgi:hypothetical protein
MFYFDPSGNSLSFPSGLKNYNQSHNYYFMIKTNVSSTHQIASVTYLVSLSLPTGENPISNIQLVNFINVMIIIIIIIRIYMKYYLIKDVCMLDCVLLFLATKKLLV